MRIQRALAIALVVAGCQGGTPSPPAPPARNPASGAVGVFEGRVNPVAGTLRFGGGAGSGSSARIVPVGEGPGGVTLTSAGVLRSGSGCSGTAFEGDVTITNQTGATLYNVYAEVLTLGKTGAEACNSSAAPRPGSSIVSSVNGLWAYGNIPAGGSGTVHWKFNDPSSTPYTFTGRVLTSGTLDSRGAGGAGGAAIDDLLVDSDSEALYVTVTLSPPPTGNNLYLLVDDADRTSGMSGPDALTYDPDGSGALSFPAVHALANGAGADFDYYQVALFGADGTATARPGRTITGAAASAAAAGTAMTQDAAAGRYNFRIPYAAIGSGALPGEYVRVYALYGEDNQFGLGIHSAAPAPTQLQVDLMNVPDRRGLEDLDTAPPGHRLAAPPCAPPVVISAVYGGGGGATGVATYNRDYVELHNRGDQPFTIPAGWSLQYATSTGNFGSSPQSIYTFAQTTIPAGGYFLVAGPAGAVGAALPVVPDGAASFSMSSTSAKVLLASDSVANRTCPALTASVVDLVGYGTTNLATCAGQGAAIALLSTTTGAVRNGDGCFDTDVGAADFTVTATPVPRNSLSPAVPCPAVCQ